MVELIQETVTDPFKSIEKCQPDLSAESQAQDIDLTDIGVDYYAPVFTLAQQHVGVDDWCDGMVADNVRSKSNGDAALLLYAESAQRQSCHRRHHPGVRAAQFHGQLHRPYHARLLLLLRSARDR